MLCLLSSTLTVATREDFESSRSVLRNTLQNLLCNDLALLLRDPVRDGRRNTLGTTPTDEDSRVDLDERIRNSLDWFRSRLTAPSFTESLPFQELLEPLYDPTSQRVTTPAYLVLQALLGSYLGFTQPHYHDFLSSVLARDELTTGGYPEAFANVVAALIEFQNIVRTALLSESEREIGVWTGTEFKVDDGTLVPVLSREIRKQWQGAAALDDQTVILAHLAVALSYENRWSEYSAESARWQGQCRQAEVLFNAFADSRSTAEGALCIFEFASYAVGKGDLPAYAQIALNRLFANQVALPQRVWLSFGRFWSSAETKHFRRWLKAGTTVGFTTGKYEPLQALRPAFQTSLSTCFACLDLSAGERFQLLFDRTLPGGGGHVTAWDLLAEAFTWFSNRRHLGSPPLSELPVAAVGTLLRMLQVIQPELFCLVQLTHPHPHSADDTPKHRTLVLPVDYPVPAELAQLIAPPSRWLQPKLVVARYLAAEMLNQRLAYGAGPVGLEIQLGRTEGPTAAATAAGWLQAVDWVEKYNHHGNLQRYLEQAASPREELAEDLLRGASHHPLLELTGQLWALCVDIGGTVIKGGLYAIEAEPHRLTDESRVSFSYPTEPDQGEFAGEKRYADGEHFARRLHNQVLAACEESIRIGDLNEAEAFRPIAFVGLSWPGPVAGDQGREYVAANSRILARFSGLTDEIAGNSLLRIHALRIREHVAGVFGTSERFGRQAPLVVLMSDSKAHSSGALAQFERQDLPAGRTLVLTAGAGITLGVLSGRKALPVLADVGKFVIDLAAPLPLAGDLPAGTGNRLFSTTTFIDLAGQVIAESGAGAQAQGILPIQPIELEFYCSHLLGQPDQPIEQYAGKLYGSYAEAQLKNPVLPPEGGEDALVILDSRKQQLIHALRAYSSPHQATLERVAARLRDDYLFDGFHRFVLEITFRAGCLLADLIAAADGLFDATTVLASGGPMAGALGKLVRAFARDDLEQGYSYKVIERFAENRDRQRLLRLRGIYFPEPGSPEKALVSASATWGAGMAALAVYQECRQAQERARLDEWLRTCPPGARVEVTRPAGPTGSTRFSRAGERIESALIDAAGYVDAHQLHLGLCRLPGAGDIFLKIDNPDPHVL